MRRSYVEMTKTLGSKRRGFALLLFAIALVPAGCSSSTEGKGMSPVPTLERSAIPAPLGDWQACPGVKISLNKGTLKATANGAVEVIAEQVIGLPSISADGKRAAFAHRSEDSFGTSLSVLELGESGIESIRTLVGEGTPDRVSISPDGNKVAYVASSFGLASVWIVPFEGGSPTLLTNRHVRKVEKGKPDGFVEPPLEPPHFQGNELHWSSKEGPKKVVLP